MQRLDLRTPRRPWYLAAVLCVGACAGVLLLTLPERLDQLWARHVAWRQTTGQLAQAETGAATLAALDRQQRRLDARLDTLLVQGRGERSMASVIEALHREAAACGVRIHELRPGEREAATSHRRVPLRLVLQGRFRDLIAFLHTVEQSSALMPVRYLDLAPAAPGAASLRAEIHLDLITLKAAER